MNNNRDINLYNITPTFYSVPLSIKSGKEVFLKMECYQPTGSFKLRGIGQLCVYAVQQGYKLIVCPSGGNAGIAAAFACNKLEVQSIIIVPKTTPELTCRLIQNYGAKVIVHGEVWDESNILAKELAKKDNGFYVSAFDHQQIWKGNATLVDELVAQIEKPDVIVCSVGGGGLLCGIIEGLHKNTWTDVPVIAVETMGAPVFYESYKAGTLVRPAQINTIASSLASYEITTQLMVLKERHQIISCLTSDAAAVSACLNFVNDHKVLVEPACGASLSIIYDNSYKKLLGNYKRVAVIVCGGYNVTLEKLNEWAVKLL